MSMLSVKRGNIFGENWAIANVLHLIPLIEGIDKTPYITNKEIFSLENLPRSMVAIGGGPISIEMAQAFSRLGTKVKKNEMGKQIHGVEDKEMAASLWTSSFPKVSISVKLLTLSIKTPAMRKRL
jgi:pyruvate/2-oxoglutarate dehydrogenase complex dihydrolipoamide dehydrogenase (E3) component